MCGIFGFWLNKPLEQIDIVNGIKSLEKLNHRGPDSSNFWYDEKKGIFLGHTRLSIIGIESKNKQPFINKKSVLIYNGELYNYLELKKFLLTKNYKFFTNTDTEVIQYAWDYYGTKCFDHFDGMYAFAIYDYNNMYLAVDNFGEKPIYYFKNDNGIYFSSEPKNLIDLNKITFSPSKSNIIDFISLGFIRNPETGFKDLKCLPQSTIMKINKNHNFKLNKFWKLDTIKNKKKYFEESDFKYIRNLLIESTESRLVADVNVGVFLSSGIDSTLLATLISRELNKKIDTFTLSFPDGVDEKLFVKEITNYLNLKNYSLNYLNDDYNINLNKSLSEIYYELNDNSTALSIRQLSKFAVKYIKVAVGGVGGDELFYGYNKYKDALHYQKYMFLENKVSRLILNLINIFIQNEKIDNALEYLDKNDYYRFIALKNIYIKKILKRLNLLPLTNFFENLDKNYIDKIRDFDLNNTLQNSYLKSIDRGSMNQSLELRSPYLNKKLFEFINLFDSNIFLKNNSKFDQKKILSEYLPKKLINTQKKGFISPLKINKNLLESKLFPNYLVNLIDYSNININSNKNDKLYSRLSLIKYFYEHNA